MEKNDFANFLIEKNKITIKQIIKLQSQAKLKNCSWIVCLAKQQLLSIDCLSDLYSRYYNIQYENLMPTDFVILEELKTHMLYQHLILPIKKTKNNIIIASIDPCNIKLKEILQFKFNKSIKLILGRYDQLQNGILLYSNKRYKQTVSQLVDNKTNHFDKINVYEDSPIINFVDGLLQIGVSKNISDIHIETYQDNCRVRFRQDGLLYEAQKLPKQLSTRLISRLKIMANLNITERRFPQDGHFQIEKGSKNYVDVRINTCPTIFGEKIVLRLLNEQHVLRDINELGFNEKQKTLFLKTISKPQGLILVTGPTGSGKTTTLYTALSYLNNIEKNIITIEDPVEIKLSGINQVQVNNKIGLNFANTLRSLLRQDPDILMVGEIRDTETAEIAIKAAQTGHLVFSTLHTNNAVATLNRLRNIGIADYNIFSAVVLITAQRLLRKLCPHCKICYTPNTELQRAFNLPKNINIYRAKGCRYCNLGYIGRVAIHELLHFKDIKQEKKISSSYINLKQQGINLASKGLTTLNELVRVLDFNQLHV